MKKAKFIINFLVIAMVLSFSLNSCEDEIDKSSTHTDASGIVVGSYTGTLFLDTTATYSDVNIVLTQIESDSIQAVSFQILSPIFDFNGASGLDLSAILNVGKANDDCVLSSGYTPTLRLSGRWSAGDLVMKLPIQVKNSNQEVRFHTNGLGWEFVGTKN